MIATSDTSYTDAKGRTRWQHNDWLAERLKELGEFLVIGGYEESHAVVYKRLSYTISRYPASVERLLSEGRLAEIPDVGPTIAALTAMNKGIDLSAALACSWPPPLRT